MDVQKIMVKLFAEDPQAIRPREVIPIFHRWIQTGRVEGTLIDVADYSHLADGPGVVLVGHDANYSMDSSEGPPGLLYSRKTPRSGTAAERIRAAFRDALDAAAKLEQDPETRGRLRFKGSEARLIFNDRLLAPNTDEAFAALRPDIERALAGVYPQAGIEIRRDASDPRRRLAVHVSIARLA